MPKFWSDMLSAGEGCPYSWSRIAALGARKNPDEEVVSSAQIRLDRPWLLTVFERPLAWRYNRAKPQS
jgi:hypothetical protein